MDVLTMFYFLAIGAYLFGLAATVCLCRMAKLSAEFQFSAPASPAEARSDLTRVPLSVPVRPIPFATPPHTRPLRA